MNLTRTLWIFKKNLLEMVREPKLTAILLSLPLFMLLITYVGYGTKPKLPTYPLLVNLQDPRGAGLVEELRTRQYADGRPIFTIREIADRAGAEAEVKAQKAVALLTLATDTDGQLAAILYGDGTSMTFTGASTQLSAPVLGYLNRAVNKPRLLALEEKPLTLYAPQSEFETYAPGMIIFAILMIIPQTATLISRELRWGTLKRLKLTLLSGAEFLTGISLSQLVLAVFQVLLLFAFIVLLGFNNRGSLLLAIVIGLLLSLCSIGQGLIVGCFTANDSQSVNTGATVTMLQVFMSGAFFGMPAMTLFTLAGRPIDLFDFIPATHAMLALQQVMVSGAGWEQVGFRLGMTALLSVVYLLAGVVFFTRWHKM